MIAVDVVVLAGGRGTRLASVYQGPKGLVPIRQKPVVAHVIDWCRSAKPNRVIVAAGHRGAELGQVLKILYGSDVQICIESYPLGTGGCIAALLPSLSDPFVAVNGDALVEGDLNQLVNYHRLSAGLATIGLFQTDRMDVGVIVADQPLPGRVREFIPAQQRATRWANGGVYALAHSVFDGVCGAASLEREVLSRVVALGKANGFPLTRVYDIGTPERLKEAEQAWWGELETGNR